MRRVGGGGLEIWGGGQNKGASAETFNSQVRGCRVPG